MLPALKHLTKTSRSNRARRKYQNLLRDWTDIQIRVEKARPGVEKRLQELRNDFA